MYAKLVTHYQFSGSRNRHKENGYEKGFERGGFGRFIDRCSFAELNNGQNEIEAESLFVLGMQSQNTFGIRRSNSAASWPKQSHDVNPKIRLSSRHRIRASGNV